MSDRGTQLPATFILFAYNQERFVGEAVRAALAQAYEPLEIVLSDDCSTDATFDVMCRAASEYHGPHPVRLVRNPANLGVIQHVLRRGREAQGEVVVVAAGDDVSEPSRVASLVAAFAADPRVLAADSLVDIIDAAGAVVHAGAERPEGLRRPVLYLRNPAAPTIQGCAAAYRKSVFAIPVPPQRLVFAEDILLAFYIDLIGGRKATVPRALVRYRRHAAAQTNRARVAVDVETAERAEVDAARVRLTLLDVMESLVAARHAESRFDRVVAARARRWSELVIAWAGRTSWQRIGAVARAAGSLRFENLKWMAARVGGTFPAYQPKKIAVRLQGWRQRG